jgi:hypothetical protein
LSESQSPHKLIEQAFDQARRAGKPDWWVMAIPVLKNRILQITERKFREADYGAKSFREFLRNASDVIELQEAPLPGQVTLRSAAATEVPSKEVPSKEANPKDIRPDLWEAVLDFSSGIRYVWDRGEARARQADDGEQAVLVPTITADEFDGWRRDFANLYRSGDEPTVKQLEHWRDARLPTLALPPACRGPWNKYLKNHVKKHLEKWFEDNHLGGVPDQPIPRRQAQDDELQELRDFVVRCVQHMSKAELEDLRLGPVSVLRVLPK